MSWRMRQFGFLSLPLQCRERDGRPRCLAEDARVVSVFSLLFSLSFNVLRRAKVKRLFVLTVFNSQDCRKDAGRFCGFPGPAVVPGEILPQWGWINTACARMCVWVGVFAVYGCVATFTDGVQRLIWQRAWCFSETMSSPWTKVYYLNEKGVGFGGGVDGAD